MSRFRFRRFHAVCIAQLAVAVCLVASTEAQDAQFQQLPLKTRWGKDADPAMDRVSPKLHPVKVPNYQQAYVKSPLAVIGGPHRWAELQSDFEGRGQVPPRLKALAEFKNSKQIVFELRYLQIPSDKVKAFYAALKPDSIKFSSAQIPSVSDRKQKKQDATKDQQLVNRSCVTQCRPALLALINQEQLKAIVKMTKSNADWNTTQAPTVTAFDGQSANVTDMSLRPFVVGISKVEKDGLSAYQPIIQTIEEGSLFCFQGKVEGESIKLTCDQWQCQIMDVDKFEIPEMDGLPSQQVQVPTQKINRLSFQETLKNGSGILIDHATFKTMVPKPNALNKAPLVGKFLTTKQEAKSYREFVLVRVSMIEPIKEEKK